MRAPSVEKQGVRRARIRTRRGASLALALAGSLGLMSPKLAARPGKPSRKTAPTSTSTVPAAAPASKSNEEPVAAATRTPGDALSAPVIKEAEASARRAQTLAEVTPAEAPRAKSADTPAPAKAAAPSNAELERLRADYDRLREQLFRARVRSQQVEGSVYKARFDATLVWEGRPDFVVAKARVLLDGAEIWDSGDRNETDDKIQIAERPIKPGPHALTVRMEIRPRTEQKGGTRTGLDRLGYTSEHTFAITVADNKLTHALITADEDGDPPEYEPEMELELEQD